MKILLVAPNVSLKMGGEAIKAWNIMLGLKSMGLEVVQLTHARVRSELESASLPSIKLEYLDDDWIQKLLFRMRMLWALSAWSAWLLHKRAGRLAEAEKVDLVHFVSPISTTLPYFTMRGAKVIIGPLNGNIHHPPALASREEWHRRLASAVLPFFQRVTARFFHGKQRASRLLVAGGDRTIAALQLGGCSSEHMVQTLDSGVSEVISSCPRIEHVAPNREFVFVGRLVRFKGCDLAIKAVARTQEALLHVVGDGPERSALEALALKLEVADRVIFHGWVLSGEPLLRIMRRARAFVLPSLAEANGIVVQEAMSIGLPVIAVNWGGPALLIDAESGILVDPVNEDHIVAGVAEAMDRLASRAEEAEYLSRNGYAKAKAEGFNWLDLLARWLEIYRDVLSEGSKTTRMDVLAPALPKRGNDEGLADS